MVNTDKLLDSMKPLLKTLSNRAILITVAGIADDGDSMAFVVPAGATAEAVVQDLVARSVEAAVSSIVEEKKDIPDALEGIRAILQKEAPDEMLVVDGRKKVGVYSRGGHN